jgi:hypothetical protein
MQPASKRSGPPAHPETWLLASILAIAALLLAFGLIASEVMEGSTLAFDRHVILAFAAPPIHPTGHHERKGPPGSAPGHTGPGERDDGRGRLHADA